MEFEWGIYVMMQESKSLNKADEKVFWGKKKSAKRRRSRMNTRGRRKKRGNCHVEKK